MEPKIVKNYIFSRVDSSPIKLSEMMQNAPEVDEWKFKITKLIGTCLGVYMLLRCTEQPEHLNHINVVLNHVLEL